MPSDTTPRARRELIERLRQRSPEQRFLMGISLCVAGRQFIEASLVQQGLQRGSLEFNEALVIRLYRGTIPERHLEQLRRYWKQSSRG